MPTSRSYSGNRCSGGLLSNARGIGIVAVLLIVFMLALIGGVISTIIATGSVAKTNEVVREQAFGLAQAGLEYALKRIDDGADPNGDVRYLGRGQFSVSYNASTGLITVNTNVSSMQGAASPRFSIQGPVSGNMADCLAVDVSGATLYGAGKDQLRGITLRNTCNTSITVSAMTNSWSPSASERLTTISINGVNVYAVPQPPLASGASADITDTAISSCTTVPLSTIAFNSNMDSKNFTIVFTMSDGTTKQAFVQFITNNEAACLNVDINPAYVGYTGYVRLLGGTLSNTCSAPTNIRLAGMTISWTPTTPSRRTTAVDFGNPPTEWTGSVTTGTAINLATAVDIAGGTSIAETYLQFNGDMRARNFTITYRMRDNTTKTVTLGNMASCLQVNTAAECVGPSGSRTDLQGQQWLNTCSGRIITVHQTATSWNGLTGRRQTAVQVNNQNVWTGSLASGGTADLNPDVSIAGGAAATVNYYRFNGDMSGRRFTQTITMSDTGTVAVPQVTPPNCP